MSARPRVSIRTIVAGTTAAIVAAAVLSVGFVAERNTRRALSREAEARLLLEARNLALTGAGALLSELPELTLHPLVRELTEARPELRFAVVLDHRGVVQGHREARAIGGRWEAPKNLVPIETSARLREGESLNRNRSLLVASSPVTSLTGQHLGTVVVALELASVDREVAAARRQQLLIVSVVLLLGMLVAFVLLTALLRPIVALRAGLERIGRGNLDSPIVLRDRTELGMLAASVNDMAADLRIAQREALEKERLAREVEIARDIQQRLLPGGARVSGEFTLQGAQRAAAEVGGDYFDVLDLPGGRLGIAIADVSGKGLGGCLVMSMLAALLRAIRTGHASPASLIVELERQLSNTLQPGEFVTLFYGVLDPHSGELTYASAGHTPLLIWRAGAERAEWHRTRGIPLGLVPGRLASTLEDHRLTIGRGDLLFQFTDGFSEAANAAGEEFGFDRISEVVAAHARRGPQAVIDALTRALEAWSGGASPEDDQTVLAAARASEPALAGSPPAIPSSEDPRLSNADPLRCLALAEASGGPLVLAARLESLDALTGWLATLPEIAALPENERVLVETALYELCANIVEHGSAGGGSEPLDLWWVPGFAQALNLRGRVADSVPVRDGCFLIRDRGFPFHPGRQRPFDPATHSAWSRGRGLGIDLVRLAVNEVAFHPATTAGNLTMLTFDSSTSGAEPGERLHG